MVASQQWQRAEAQSFACWRASTTTAIMPMSASCRAERILCAEVDVHERHAVVVMLILPSRSE